MNGIYQRCNRAGELAADVGLGHTRAERAVLDQVQAVMQPVASLKETQAEGEAMHVNGLVLDMAGHSLTDAAGRDITLTRGEFALLATLMRRPGQVLSRDRLLDAVSGRSADTFDRSIDNLIARLRRKIGEDAKQPRLIVTVPGAGYKFLPQRHQSEGLPATATTSGFSIGVIPFVDLSGGPELAEFVRSVSAMLTADLKHIVGASMIGRDAAVTMRDSAANIPETRRHSAARYVVQGSARRRGDIVRVNVEVSNTKTNTQVWADSYDGELADLFSFEKAVARRIARAIDLELVEIESRNCRDRARGPQVVDLVTNGYAQLYRPRSRENLAAARACFEHALRLDNRCPEALAGLAQTHLSYTLCLWSDDPAVQVRLADDLATRALELRPKLAYAYHVKGVALRLQWQHERAIAALEMAAQLNPSLAPARAEIGFAKHLLGRGDRALAYAHDGVAVARGISPRDPVLANWLFGIGVASLHTGETVEAIRWLNESIGVHLLPAALPCLAAAYALSGNDEQARIVLREFAQKHPNETLRSFRSRTQVDYQIFPRSRVYEGLLKAGLPEQ